MSAGQAGGGRRSPTVVEMYAEVKGKVGLPDPRYLQYVVPTGSPALDRALVIGGYPSGRIIEIYGPEHSGKTTLAMHACIEVQKMGKMFAFIDYENALDIAYFKRMGVQGEANVDWLHIVPEVGEDAFTVMHMLIERGVSLFVFDSVSAMVPRAEFAGDMGEAFMGLQARMMGQGMRTSVGRVSRGDTVAIFINQVRQKIGVVFGNPETTTGGNALKFYASIRLDIRQTGDEIKDEDGVIVGRYSRVKVKKNKLAPPFREAQVPIVFGRGVALEMELFDDLIIQGLVSKTSSYFTFPSGERFNGKRNALVYVNEHLGELAEMLKNKKKSSNMEDMWHPGVTTVINGTPPGTGVGVGGTGMSTTVEIAREASGEPD